MIKLHARRAAVSVLLLSVLSVSSAVIATPADAATRNEKSMAHLINAARNHYGVRGMHFDGRLSALAQKHSRLMAAQATIFHTSNLAGALHRYHWTLAGENVGMGPGLAALHTAFMNSPPHRHNNLDRRFHRFGVGIVWANGIAYVTVEFLS
jgi:uncharacterized protein YkwD